VSHFCALLIEKPFNTVPETAAENTTTTTSSSSTTTTSLLPPQSIQTMIPVIEPANRQSHNNSSVSQTMKASEVENDSLSGSKHSLESNQSLKDTTNNHHHHHHHHNNNHSSISTTSDSVTTTLSTHSSDRSSQQSSNGQQHHHQQQHHHHQQQQQISNIQQHSHSGSMPSSRSNIRTLDELYASSDDINKTSHSIVSNSKRSRRSSNNNNECESDDVHDHTYNK
jgi:hypothetical protein